MATSRAMALAEEEVLFSFSQELEAIVDEGLKETAVELESPAGAPTGKEGVPEEKVPLIVLDMPQEHKVGGAGAGRGRPRSVIDMLFGKESGRDREGVVRGAGGAGSQKEQKEQEQKEGPKEAQGQKEAEGQKKPAEQEGQRSKKSKRGKRNQGDSQLRFPAGRQVEQQEQKQQTEQKEQGGQEEEAGQKRSRKSKRRRSLKAAPAPKRKRKMSKKGARKVEKAEVPLDRAPALKRKRKVSKTRARKVKKAKAELSVKGPEVDKEEVPEERSPPGLEVDQPDFRFEDTLRCSRCKGPVDPARVQVVGKSGRMFRCNTCNSRAVSMSRLPQWQEFQKKLKSMPSEVKQQFWADAHERSGRDDLMEYLKERELLMERRTESTSASKGGVYQPLSWYAAQGYDASAIEKFCGDKKPHPILGMTYRVVLEGATSSTVQEKVKESQVEAGHSSGGGGSGGTGKKDPKQPGEGGGADPLPEDPKPKDPPKDAAALARERKQQQSLASRQMSKIALVLLPLQSVLKDKKAAELPEVALQGAKDVLAQLQAVESECKMTMRSSCGTLTRTMADITDLVAGPISFLLILVLLIQHVTKRYNPKTPKKSAS